MTKAIGAVMLFIGTAGALMASPVPEIDPGFGANGLLLLSGSLLVVRAARRKR